MEDGDDGEADLRTVRIEGSQALIHWWFKPSSYDEWIPGNMVEGEAPESNHDPNTAWKVVESLSSSLRLSLCRRNIRYSAFPFGPLPPSLCCHDHSICSSNTQAERFLIDLEKHNEWMVELDYEIDDDESSIPDEPMPPPPSIHIPVPQQNHHMIKKEPVSTSTPSTTNANAIQMPPIPIHLMKIKKEDLPPVVHMNGTSTNKPAMNGKPPSSSSTSTSGIGLIGKKRSRSKEPASSSSNNAGMAAPAAKRPRTNVNLLFRLLSLSSNKQQN